MGLGHLSAKPIGREIVSTPGRLGVRSIGQKRRSTLVCLYHDMRPKALCVIDIGWFGFVRLILNVLELKRPRAQMTTSRYHRLYKYTARKRLTSSGLYERNSTFEIKMV